MLSFFLILLTIDLLSSVRLKCSAFYRLSGFLSFPPCFESPIFHRLSFLIFCPCFDYLLFIEVFFSFLVYQLSIVFISILFLSANLNSPFFIDYRVFFLLCTFESPMFLSTFFCTFCSTIVEFPPLFYRQSFLLSFSIIAKCPPPLFSSTIWSTILLHS